MSEARKVTADLDTIQHQADENGKEVSRMSLTVRETIVKDADSYQAGVELVTRIKTTYKRIEAVRLSIVSPIKAAMDAANGFFKPHLANLLAAETDMKSRLARYAQEAAAKKNAELLAAAKAAEKAKSPAAQERAQERVMAAIESAPVPKVAGMSMRTIYSGEVVDANLIPREYLTPDTKALLAVTRARKGDVNIPGWKVTSSQSVAVGTTGMDA